MMTSDKKKILKKKSIKQEERTRRTKHSRQRGQDARNYRGTMRIGRCYMDEYKNRVPKPINRSRGLEWRRDKGGESSRSRSRSRSNSWNEKRGGRHWRIGKDKDRFWGAGRRDMGRTWRSRENERGRRRNSSIERKRVNDEERTIRIDDKRQGRGFNVDSQEREKERPERTRLSRSGIHKRVKKNVNDKEEISKKKRQKKKKKVIIQKEAQAIKVQVPEAAKVVARAIVAVRVDPAAEIEVVAEAKAEAKK